MDMNSIGKKIEVQLFLKMKLYLNLPAPSFWRGQE